MLFLLKWIQLRSLGLMLQGLLAGLTIPRGAAGFTLIRAHQVRPPAVVRQPPGGFTDRVVFLLNKLIPTMGLESFAWFVFFILHFLCIAGSNLLTCLTVRQPCTRLDAIFSLLVFFAFKTNAHYLLDIRFSGLTILMSQGRVIFSPSNPEGETQATKPIILTAFQLLRLHTSQHPNFSNPQPQFPIILD